MTEIKLPCLRFVWHDSWKNSFVGLQCWLCRSTESFSVCSFPKYSGDHLSWLFYIPTDLSIGDQVGNLN